MTSLAVTLALLHLTLIIRTDCAISYFGCSTTTTQRIRGELFCDGVYHCFDRFDESITACGKDKNRSLSVKDTREILGIPVALPVRSPWYGWSDLPADFNLTGGLFEECEMPRGQSRGVSISGECLAPTNLCSDWDHQSGYIRFKGSLFFDRQHISICKNLTYWEGLQQNSDSDHVPCNGNFPGFQKVGMDSRCNLNPSLSKCPDLSDVRLCPGNRCLDNPDYFRCHDGQFCIFHELQCDGYPQCLDGSDEDENVCGVCNRTGGYPHRSGAVSAGFSCRHRYTGRLICAVRCDGRDDLCVAFADEVGCGANSVLLRPGPDPRHKADLFWDWLVKFYFAMPALNLFLLLLIKFVPSALAYLRGEGAPAPAHIRSKHDGPQYYDLYESECCLIPCHILNPKEFHGPVMSSEGRDWQQYTELRMNPDFRIALENLTSYCTRGVRFPFYAQSVTTKDSVYFTANTSRLYYNKEKHFKYGSISKTDQFFFWVLRSSNLSGLFYDHVDMSLMTTIWLTVLRWSSPIFAELIVLLARILSGVHKYVLLHVVSLLLHSWDWLKDVLLAVAIWQVASSAKSTFPTALFTVIVLSLVMNEVAICAVYYIHPRRVTIQTWHLSFQHLRAQYAKCLACFAKKCSKCFISRRRFIRLAALMLWILIPVAKLHMMVIGIETGHRSRAEAWACLDGEVEEKVVSEDIRDQVRLAEALLAKLRERCNAIKSMIAWMKMTSNILEDFVQLTILLLIISYTYSDTSLLDGGAGTSEVIFKSWLPNVTFTFIPEEWVIPILFGCLSLVSIILGHLGLLTANKNGYTSLVGHWLIAFPYFLVSTAGRIFSVILFYTPILGLFDTLYHSSKGQIPANSDQWSVEHPWYDNSEADLGRNVSNFHEIWPKLQIEKDSDFFTIPFWVGTVPALIVVVHVTFGYVFLRRVLGTHEGILEDIPVDKNVKGEQYAESDIECPCDENTEPEDDKIDEEAEIQDDDESEPREQESEPHDRFRSLKIGGRHVLFSLWTVMCPPLFLDWEEILRNHTDRPDVFAKEPWERPLPKELGPRFHNIAI